MTETGVVAQLTGGQLPPGFVRRRLSLRPGERLPTTAAAWADEIVLVERGSIEVICREDARRTFGPGDVLCLGWLPLRALSNPGPEVARLVAIRRRDDDSQGGIGFPR